jgi:hypothetical protein
VSLTVTHRVKKLPGPPPVGTPRELLRFAADLDFTRDSVAGLVPDDLVAAFGDVRRLVHAVRATPTGRTVYRFYDVTVRTPGAETLLTGALVDVRPLPPFTLAFPPRPLRFPADHIGLFDATRDLIGGLLPLPVETDETVPLMALSNSVEDRLLLIPTNPLAPDSYTFTFTIDRERYRAAVADDESRYRATAVLHVVL